MKKELRLRAEKLLKDEKLAEIVQHSEGIAELLHELYIHQIELEMQNEELRQAQQELVKAEEKYFNLYHLAPIGYFTFDGNGVILELNLRAARLLGKQRAYLAGKPMSPYLVYDSNQIFSDHLKLVLDSERRQTCELILRRGEAQKTPVYVQVESVAARDPAGDRRTIRSTMTNITARRLAEQAVKEAHDQLEQRVEERTAELKQEIELHRRTQTALQESEARYKLLLASVTDYIYTVRVEDQQPTATSHGPNCAAVTGYTLQEYEDDPNLWYRMVHHEDRAAVTAQAQKLLSGEAVPPLEHRLVHKDGSIRWVRHTPVLRRNSQGQVIAYDGLISDITERRRLEEQLAAIHRGGQELTRLRDVGAILQQTLETVLSVFQCEAAGCGMIDKLSGGTNYLYFPAIPARAHSQIVVPMQVGLQHIGELEALSRTADYFSADDLRLLQTLADQAAVALENARLYGEIQQRAEAEHTARQQADMLREATVALTCSINLNEVLNSILVQLKRVVPYDSACVFLWDEEQLHAVAGRGKSVQQKVVGQKYSLEQLFDDGFDQEGHPLILVNSLYGMGSTEHIPGWISVPLAVRGEVSGYLTLDSKDTARYSRPEEMLAQAFANQAAIAINNARLFEAVRAGHEQLQFLSRRLVEVQEMERRQIARELHDEIGQTLTGMMVELRLLAREAHQPQSVLARVAELEQTSNIVSESLHRLAMNLRPASLDHVGLIAALRQYTEDFKNRCGIDAQFEAIGFESKRLPQEMEATIYRIVQEALTNVVRHAHASRVDVVLKWDNNQLITIIEDNGAGFDPRLVGQKNRLGLLGMRERAEMLGGQLLIESTEGVGTTILVEVPNVDSHFDH